MFGKLRHSKEGMNVLEQEHKYLVSKERFDALLKTIQNTFGINEKTIVQQTM